MSKISKFCFVYFSLVVENYFTKIKVKKRLKLVEIYVFRKKFTILNQKFLFLDQNI